MIKLLSYGTQIYLFAVEVKPLYLEAAVGLFDRGLCDCYVTLTNEAESFRVEIPKEVLNLSGRSSKLNVRLKIS